MKIKLKFSYHAIFLSRLLLRGVKLPHWSSSEIYRRMPRYSRKRLGSPEGNLSTGSTRTFAYAIS